ncbi:BnaC02g17250D [Brassica napus]|uniref:Midasin n=1 Tax=Brassica napus TaxID=3708 RepID=A0A078I5E1_BRANA|nr:BnaC02g17250D [Brassica napus]
MKPLIELVSKESSRAQPLQRYLGELKGSSDESVKKYVKTKSVIEHLHHLAHAIFVKRYPVLLQGPTSSGKTSLVKYLAALSGNKFVRINNHEQTDIQEYLGSYMTDSSGKLVFHEGALVKAVRDGHWIVLDELNLAPSDVLEALNRLLDDNRELFVPELGETISAHPNFMLFATQNPPASYGGRKILSRAFRNRFVEIHVDELSEILFEKCEIAKSHATKIVDVMKDLQRNRQSSKAFANFDVAVSYHELLVLDLLHPLIFILIICVLKEAAGLTALLLSFVLYVILMWILIFSVLFYFFILAQQLLKLEQPFSMKNQTVTWTRSMWRLFFLIERCYELREPVLLVGETGGGKTTICQLLSEYKKLGCTSLTVINTQKHLISLGVSFL